MTTQAALNLTIGGCVDEVKRQAHDRGEALDHETAHSRAYELLQANTAIVRDRTIALLRERGVLPGGRPAPAAPASTAAPPDLRSVLRCEVDAAIGEGLDPGDAIEAVRQDVETAFEILQREHAKASGKTTAKAPKVAATGKKKSAASQAADEDDDDATESDGATMSNREEPRDIGKLAEVLLTRDPAMSREAAFNAAYAQLYGDRPLTMRPNGAIIVNRSIPTRREVRATRGGAK